MSYEKQNWITGNRITAEKLNHMEDGIEEASDKGYSCTEEWATLTDESVTPTKAAESDLFAYADLAYAESITADAIRVTFNGTEYICQRHTEDNVYGALFNDAQHSFDWSEYPFSIASFLDGSFVTNSVATETAGTYQVKIEAPVMSAVVTPCFKKAVASSLETEEVTFQNLRLVSCILTNKLAVTIPANSSATVTLNGSADGDPVPISDFFGLQSIKTNHNELVVCSFDGKDVTLYNTSSSAITLAAGECVGRYIAFNTVGGMVYYTFYSPKSSDGGGDGSMG